jgi:hypothetical protein
VTGEDLAPVDAPRAEDDFDRVRSMFAAGAPDVGIGGVSVSRATIVTIDDVEGESSGSGLQWHISAYPSSDDDLDSVALSGDLAVIEGGWFVGVTVVMRLHFRDRSVVPRGVDDANELAKTMGPWSSNILYDVAAIQARQLVASSLVAQVAIPVQTPQAHITRVRPRRADDGE